MWRTHDLTEEKEYENERAVAVKNKMAAVNCGLSCVRSSPDRAVWVPFEFRVLGQTFYSCSACLHPGV